MIAPSKQISAYQDVVLRLEPGSRRQQLLAHVEPPATSNWSGLPDQFEVFLPVEPWEVDEALASVGIGGPMSKFKSSGYGRQDRVIALGETLFNGLIDRTPLKDVYWGAEAQLRSEGIATRLRLVMDHPGVAGIPWELMFDPYRSDYLALSDVLPLVVRQKTAALRAAEPAPAPLRLLVVIAEVVPMDAGAEVELLQEIANSSPLLEVDIHTDVTKPHLLALLASEDHHALHLIGTGINMEDQAGSSVRQGWSRAQDRGHPVLDQRLVLMSEGGPPTTGGLDETALVLPNEFASALAQGGGMEFVFLNGCDTHVFAQELSSLVPAVLGARGKISAPACTAFARGLYATLAQGAGLESAVTQARQAVDRTLPGSREWGLLQFHLSAEAGLRIVPQTRSTEDDRQPEPKPTRPDGEQDRRRWRLEQMLRVQKENRAALQQKAAAFGKNPPQYIQSQIEDIEQRIADLEKQIADLD